MILKRIEQDIFGGEFFPDALKLPLKRGRRKQAAEGTHGLRIGRRIHVSQGLADFLVQESQHTDTVFKLRVTVVARGLRERTPRGQIKLVRGLDKVDAALFHGKALRLFYNIDGLGTVLGSEELKLLQLVTVICKTDRNHRNRLHERRIAE